MLNPDIPQRLEQMVACKQSLLGPALTKEGIARNAPTSRGKAFIGSLSATNKSFILEFKPASPSKGIINQQVSVADMLKVYQPFASCISVLVDDVYFGGSYQNLAKARALTQLPLLAKDITFSIEQIQQARAHGADLILLMLSVLSDELYCELYRFAQSIGLSVITEVTNQKECQRLQRLPLECVGINHRDFSDMSIDLAKTHQLIKLLPSGIPVIAESGITTFEDFLGIHPQVAGYLIGSSLMASANPAKGLRSLLYADIKICGITRPQQAEGLIAAGAQKLGIIRTPKSARFIDDASVLSAIAKNSRDVIGVYLDQELDFVAKDAQQFGLVGIQLHGQESDDYIKALRQMLPADIAIIKVVNGAEVSNQQICELLNAGIDVLLDSQSSTQQGGTGLVFDWSRIDSELRPKVRLAGGLAADNIQQALALGYRRFDINSGIETQPGDKCLLKFNQLLAQITAFRGNNHVHG